MDLRLASTYVPALICAAKSAVVAMLARLLVPTGGASVLALSVAIDRRLMFMLPSAPSAPGHPRGGPPLLSSNPYLALQHNQVMLMAITTGFDINAIQAFVLAAAVACNERRQHALLRAGSQAAVTALLALWMLVAMVLTIRPGVLSSHKEVVLLAVLFGAIMATHDPAEPRLGPMGLDNEVAWAGVRAVAFVACVSASVYTGQSDGLLPQLMRTAPIMLAPCTPAMCFALLLLGTTLLIWHRLNAPPAAPATGPYYPPMMHAGMDAPPSAAFDTEEGRGAELRPAAGPGGDDHGGGYMMEFSPMMLRTAMPMEHAASDDGILIGGAAGPPPGLAYSDLTGNEQAQLREAIAIRQKGARSL